MREERHNLPTKVRTFVGVRRTGAGGPWPLGPRMWKKVHTLSPPTTVQHSKVLEQHRHDGTNSDNYGLFEYGR